MGAAAAHHDQAARGLRREHGGGQPALRRERLAAPGGSEDLGVKTELKNMNSFRFLERGIEAELERQGALLEGGEPVTQDTLHFDPRTGSLTALRSKEYAHDYRYFPEPDLVPLAPTEEMLRAAAGRCRAPRAAARPVPRRPARAVRRSRHPARVRGRAGELLRVGGLRRVRRGGARRDRELGHRRARGRAAPGGRGGSSFVEGRASGAGDARRNGAGEAGHARRRKAGARGTRRRRRRSGRDRRGARPRPDLRHGRARGCGRPRSRPIRTRRSGSEGNAKAIGPIVGEVMKETKAAPTAARSRG